MNIMNKIKGAKYMHTQKKKTKHTFLYERQLEMNNKPGLIYKNAYHLLIVDLVVRFTLI